jgi:predicted GIY-YIG superfamily endonuclease
MDISFNILDCFDDNIDNLDITKYYIYVLELVDNRYYVGRTGNILKRIEEHFTGCGAIYTIKYKPIKVIEIIEELTKKDERNKTLEIMTKYGWEKVRGAGWCSLEIKKPNNNLKSKNIINKDIKNENDVELEKLYNVEQKDIMEISIILKKSPCWVAKRLEIFKIIERKQLARGYIKYIESDEYKIKTKLLNLNRRENNKKNIKVVNNSSELTKDKLLDIKNIIRQKYLNDNQSANI